MKLFSLLLFILLFSCKERYNPVYIAKHGDTILVKNHDPLDIRVTIPGYRAVISVAPIVDTIPGIWFITTITPLPAKDTIGGDVIEERIKKGQTDFDLHGAVVVSRHGNETLFQRVVLDTILNPKTRVINITGRKDVHVTIK